MALNAAARGAMRAVSALNRREKVEARRLLGINGSSQPVRQLKVAATLRPVNRKCARGLTQMGIIVRHEVRCEALQR
jgi:hypothetical protein